MLHYWQKKVSFEWDVVKEARGIERLWRLEGELGGREGPETTGGYFYMEDMTKNNSWTSKYFLKHQNISFCIWLSHCYDNGGGIIH